jgi:hypothetical protein
MENRLAKISKEERIIVHLGVILLHGGLLAQILRIVLDKLAKVCFTKCVGKGCKFDKINHL